MVYNSIIGRTEEIKKLEKFLKSSKSEFVAIYGRRRVGKSYLVEEVCKNKLFFVQLAPISRTRTIRHTDRYSLNTFMKAFWMSVCRNLGRLYF